MEPSTETTPPKTKLNFTGIKVAQVPPGAERLPVKAEHPLPKLLALLRAKGVSVEEVAEYTGIPLSGMNIVLEDYGNDNFASLCTLFSTKVSKGSEERIKVAAELSISRCISILSNPATSSKEVIALAKDFMDRHFGKALQRTEFVGTFQVGEGNKEIESNLAAANKRLDELMAMRNKMIATRDGKTVEAEFHVVP